jgi:nucleoside-diphosphate kinase
MPELQRTLIIIKPDAVQRGLAGAILGDFERRGLKVVGLKLMKIDQGLAGRHYHEHEGKPFYQGLVDFITSGPVIVGALEGPDAIATVRSTMGATNPSTADPGSIRGRYAVEIGHNLIHGSDSETTAKYELGLFFRPEELLLEYSRALDSWIGM